MSELVEAVKRHAVEHYTDGGWDVIVEAWDDADIADTIGDAQTPEAAIAAVAVIVDVYADRQADARNSAW